MRIQVFAAAFAAAALMLGSPAGALQELTYLVPSTAISAASNAEQACCTVPALTVVEIEIVDDVNSKTAHPGDHFALRLAEPLALNGRVVLPAGTSGVGEVVHAAKA